MGAASSSSNRAKLRVFHSRIPTVLPPDVVGVVDKLLRSGELIEALDKVDEALLIRGLGSRLNWSVLSVASGND